MKLPPTRSGVATIVGLDDADALALQPGDVLLIEWTSGLAPMIVNRSRLGVAGEDGGLHEVPVIDATLERQWQSPRMQLRDLPLAYAVPNLFAVSVVQLPEEAL